MSCPVLCVFCKQFYLCKKYKDFCPDFALDEAKTDDFKKHFGLKGAAQ